MRRRELLQILSDAKFVAYRFRNAKLVKKYVIANYFGGFLRSVSEFSAQAGDRYAGTVAIFGYSTS